MIVPLQRSHAGAVARIHVGALAGDFLPSLGVSFLRVFYKGALDQGVGFGFVHLEKGESSQESLQPRGFVFGSADTRALFKRVMSSRMLALGVAALPATLRRPLLLRNVAETFLYPSKEGQSPHQAELVVIGVDAALRGRRIGETLVRELDRAFREQGVRAYKVTVLQSNLGANRFYQRLGFRFSFEFTLYGKKWNLYTCELESS
jgi:ribosomal protein S18 acetylase RimI-like enzyme